MLADTRGCKDCDLGEHPKHPGLPSRPWDGAPLEIRHKKALLMLGKGPGVEEDETGSAFTGPSGIHTNITYVKGGEFSKFADVYLANAIRCKLPNPAMAVPGYALRACRNHWLRDLEILDKHYDEVIILAMGSEAVTSVLGQGCSLGTFPQAGKRLLAGKERTVFATFLPAILLERADPAKLSSISVHLGLVREFLESGILRNSVAVDGGTVSRSARVPPGVRYVALDLETYGKLRAFPPQRFFHPQKSLHHDGVLRSELVQTAGMAWRNPVTGNLENRYYVLACARERDEFYDDLAGLARPDVTIVGANLIFDIMYLMEDSDAAKLIFEPFSPLNPRLEDLLVLSFLDDDTRPEKGLKSISRLLRTLEFGEEHMKGTGEYIRHDSPFDPSLGVYQIEDVYATLVGAEKILAGYKAKYGENTAKGSEFSRNWYSDLMYLVLSMSREGLRFDVPRLRTLHDKLEARLFRWEEAALLRFGVPLRRTGASKRCQVYLDCVDKVTAEPCKTEKAQAKRMMTVAALRDEYKLPPIGQSTPKDFLTEVIVRTLNEHELVADPRVAKTDQGAISVGAENINLCLGYATNRDKQFLLTWTRFHTQAKLLGTYLKPLLGLKPEPTRDDLNKALVGEYAYPTWRMVPSSDDSGEEGGTQQLRITAKGPALQTAPPSIEGCEISRHLGGCLMSKDERQVELRVPVMYSREEHIRDLFASGGTPYERAAEVVCGYPIKKKTHPGEYLLGKTVMLAVQFRASPPKLQETARRDLNIDRDLNFWDRTVKLLFADRAGLIRRQDEWIAQAKSQGFIEVPLIGASRTFLGNSNLVDRTYIPTIVNFPIQSLAAALTLDAQIAAEKWLRRNGYRTRLVKNTYDEGVYDVYPGELDAVSAKLTEFYRRPPLYDLLMEAGLYEVPLDCSTEVR